MQLIKFVYVKLGDCYAHLLKNLRTWQSHASLLGGLLQPAAEKGVQVELLQAVYSAVVFLQC